MRPTRLRTLIIVAGALAAAGCVVEPLELSGKSCPCEPGFVCEDGLCVRQLGRDAGQGAADDGPATGDAPADGPPDDGLAQPDAPEDGPPPQTDAADDGSPPSDAAPDGASGPCDWSSGVSFLPVERVADLSTPGEDFGVFLMPDGLTAYLSIAGSAGSWDTQLYRATRSDPSASFDPPALIPELASAYQDAHATLSADELEIYWHSLRPGGAQPCDIWVASRASVEDPFDGLQPAAALNSTRDEWDPHIMADGKTIYIASTGFAGASDTLSHLYVATRQDRTSPFGAPTIVPLGVTTDDSGPTLTADGRVIVFHRYFSAGYVYDLYYATRASPGVPFGPAYALTDINTSFRDWKPFITGDGCELYFSSDRPGGAGGFDLYRAVVQR